MRIITAETIHAPEWVPKRYIWGHYEPQEGDVVRFWYPFTRMKIVDDWVSEERWRPGAWIITEDYGVGYHAEGSCELVVKSVVPIPGFPRRVFYTRQFTDPDGTKMKRSGLLCHSLYKFRKVCEGGLPVSVEKISLDDCPPIEA